MSLNATRSQLIRSLLPSTDGLPALRLSSLRGWQRFGRAVFDTLWQINVHHAHQLPAGPAIIAPNHTASIDGPLVVLSTPDAFALAKSELFSSPAAALLRSAGQIPVHRRHPDVDGLRRAVQVLRAGHRLVIFPEGRRGAGDFTEFHRGVAWLAMVTGAPVVPVAILGTKPAGSDLRAVPGFRGHIDLVYGGPQHFAARPYPRRAADVEHVRAELQEACVAHLNFATRLVGRGL